MEIRVARPDDHDAIGDLTVDAYNGVNPHAMRGDYDAELRDVAARVAECTVFVAIDEDGTVIGSVTYVPGPHTSFSEFTDEDAAGIRMLAVDTARQGRGAGSALTEACIAQARLDGKRRLVLHSTELMRTARAMYARRGFRRDVDRDVWFDQEPFSPDEPFHLMAYVLDL
jgi:predicted N-acetyltransferase YhbS